MPDDTGSPDPVPGAATSSVPPSRPGLIRSIAHRLAGEQLGLRVEGRLPSFDGATGWLNSDPLSPESLRGRVVLVSFWTYTCVNWLRTLPYLRAWAAKYRHDDLTVIGVHTPEFGFEEDVDNVIAQSRRLGVDYPIALDSDYAVWGAFANHFWPAVYLADDEGRIRFHHFGEGEYPMTEMVIQQLLLDTGAGGIDQDLVTVEPRGLEVPADWRTLRSPETYVGYRQSSGHAQEGLARFDEPIAFPRPGPLARNSWGLSGTWTVGGDAAVLNERGGRVAFQFHARDLNLVLGRSSHGAPIPFRVFLDGQPAIDARGSDVDPDGSGLVSDERTYQLIRQPGAVADRLFEIEFLGAGVEAYCFTFG
jgi:thiol-disulfide isomerase/thioredoxin